MENMTEYQKNLVRMWDSLRTGHKGELNCRCVSCPKCPLHAVCGENIPLCYAEKAIEITNSWAKEHPVVTKADKFKEIFGVEPKFCNSLVCPHRAGFTDVQCNLMQCVKCANEFWNSEYKPNKEVDK